MQRGSPPGFRSSSQLEAARAAKGPVLLEDATTGRLPSASFPFLAASLLNYIKQFPACSPRRGELLLYSPFPFWRSSQEHDRAASTAIGPSGNPSIWRCIVWLPFKRSARQLPSTCAKGKRCLLLTAVPSEENSLSAASPLLGAASWTLRALRRRCDIKRPPHQR